MIKMKRIISTTELKRIQLDLLDVLDNYCANHELNYYLTYGTLIGAIRHKGYIPWDDDIDVMMPRQDYEKLLADFNRMTEKPHIRVISHEIDSDYYLPFAKLISTETVMQEEVNSKYEIGVYIDIFPLDNLSNSYESARKMVKKVYFYNELMLFKNLTYNKNRAWYKNIALGIGRILSVFWSRDKLIRQINNFGINRKDNNFTTYVGTVTGITEGDERAIFKSEWFKDSSVVEFEGHFYNAPIGYDEFLRNIYGNYMELPPVESQVSHHAFTAWYK